MEITKEQKAWLANTKSQIAEGSASPDLKKLYSQIIAKLGSGVDNPGATQGSGEGRYSFGAGNIGTGSGRVGPGRALPGHELSALDVIADPDVGQRTSKFETEDEYYDDLLQHWHNMPEDAKAEWKDEGSFVHFFRSLARGVAPFSIEGLFDKDTRAGREYLRNKYPKTSAYGEATGIIVGSLVGGRFGGKYGEEAVDILISGPRGGWRESSRRLNNAADDYLLSSTKKAKAGDVDGSLSDAVKAIELRWFDRKVSQSIKDFGVDATRRGTNSDLEKRIIDAIKMKSEDVVVKALGKNATDIMRNAIDGDKRSRGQIINVYEQYIGEPINYVTRNILADAPGWVYKKIGQISGAGMMSFFYALEHSLENGDDTDSALAKAFGYASEVNVEDILSVGRVKGLIEDVSEQGALEQEGFNKGGQVSDKISKIYSEGYIAPDQAYAIAKSMGYNKGGLLGCAKGTKKVRKGLYR